MCPQPDDEPQTLGANGVHTNGNGTNGTTNGDHEGYR